MNALARFMEDHPVINVLIGLGIILLACALGAIFPGTSADILIYLAMILGGIGGCYIVSTISLQIDKT